GLVGKTEPQHVTGNDPVTLCQRCPEVVPVPGTGWKAMDQQQRLTLSGFPVTNAMLAEHEALPTRHPRVQLDTFQLRHASPCPCRYTACACARSQRDAAY